MKGIFTFLFMILISTKAYSHIIFDTYTPPAAGGGFSSPDGGVGVYIYVSNTTVINGISIYNEMYEGGDIKFVIFDAASYELLFSTNPITFGIESGLSWKESEYFSFQLNAGTKYLVGYMRTTGVNDVYDTTQESYDGFTSGLNLASLYNFANPTFSHDVIHGADGPVRLLTNAVPLPSSALLLIPGFLALAGTRRFMHNKSVQRIRFVAVAPGSRH